MLAIVSRPSSVIFWKRQIVGFWQKFALDAVDVDADRFLAEFLESHEAWEDERVGDLFHVRGLEQASLVNRQRNPNFADVVQTRQQLNCVNNDYNKIESM